MQFSERNDYRDYFVQRFGIPSEEMQNYRFFLRGRKVWAYTGDVLDVQGAEAIGIKALTLSGDAKPSTAFLRVIGHMATRNVIELSEEDADKYLMGEDIERDFDASPGYVIVKTGNHVLGCGLYKGRLINQLPKKYRKEKTWI